jgi:hypothetical protein
VGSFTVPETVALYRRAGDKRKSVRRHFANVSRNEVIGNSGKMPEHCEPKTENEQLGGVRRLFRDFFEVRHDDDG